MNCVAWIAWNTWLDCRIQPCTHHGMECMNEWMNRICIFIASSELSTVCVYDCLVHLLFYARINHWILELGMIMTLKWGTWTWTWTWTFHWNTTLETIIDPRNCNMWSPTSSPFSLQHSHNLDTYHTKIHLIWYSLLCVCECECDTMQNFGGCHSSCCMHATGISISISIESLLDSLVALFHCFNGMCGYTNEKMWIKSIV